MKMILLVEDSKFLRLASERALKKAGYAVVSTDDGQKALQLAQESLPDAILLDMLLPNIGGDQVLRLLKNDPITAQIPVVVLSSLSQRNEGRLKQDGAAAYFEKSKLNLESDCSALLKVVDAAMN